MSSPKTARPFPTRQVWLLRLLRDVRLVWSAVLLLAAGALLMIPVAWLESGLWTAFDGRWTVGTISGKETVVHRSRRMSRERHDLLYEFRDDAKVLRTGRIQYVDRDYWRATEIGDPIDVRYSVSAPTRHYAWVGFWAASADFATVFGIAALIASVFAGWLLAGAIRRAARDVALLRDGARAEGRVVGVKYRGTYLRWPTHRDWRRIEYRFSATLPTLEKPSRFQGTFFGWSREGSRVHSGSTVLVAYDPREPENSTLVWYGIEEGDSG